MYLLTVYTPEDLIAMSCTYKTKEEAEARKKLLEPTLPTTDWVLAIRSLAD